MNPLKLSPKYYMCACVREWEHKNVPVNFSAQGVLSFYFF